MAAKGKEDMDDFEYQLQAQKEFLEASQPQEQEGYTYVDPADGTVYEWSDEKRAWFPKIDNDFIAAYQENYGFYSGEKETSSDDKKSDSEEHAKPEPPQKEAGKKTKGQSSSAPEWFDIDESQNSSVYVSGLPLDITMDEFKELVSKCGIVMEDNDGEPKLKLYCDINGVLKGDGLCCYLKVESVQLALQILDGDEFRGHKIKVERVGYKVLSQSSFLNSPHLILLHLASWLWTSNKN